MNFVFMAMSSRTGFLRGPTLFMACYEPRRDRGSRTQRPLAIPPLFLPAMDLPGGAPVQHNADPDEGVRLARCSRGPRRCVQSLQGVVRFILLGSLLSRLSTIPCVNGSAAIECCSGLHYERKSSLPGAFRRSERGRGRGVAPSNNPTTPFNLDCFHEPPMRCHSGVSPLCS